MVRIGGAVVALMLAAAPAFGQDDARPDPSLTPKAPAGVAREHATPYRTDTVELPLAPGGQEGDELDYFVRMKAGEVLVYDWAVEGGASPAEFYSEFHGVARSEPPEQVLSYREGEGTAVAGSLTAPFDGTHGWLFKNDSAKPVTVRLTIAGFYEQRSLRETMGLDGPEYVPFGPPSWPDRYGPSQK